MKMLAIGLLLVVLLGIGGISILHIAKEKVKQALAQPVSLPTESVPTPTLISTSAVKETKSYFVPYWGLRSSGVLPTADQLIYFGVTVNQQGVVTDDPGYTKLSLFQTLTKNSPSTTLLAVRMLDQKTNFAIIQNKKTSQAVIADALSFAKSHGFAGVMLDFEVSSLPFDSVINSITSFVTAFHQQAQAVHQTFAIALYGDTFYRLRPFDVKSIAKNTDQVMVMAYDFSKSTGNPGPNFPLSGEDKYGYDMHKMADDFLQFVPPEKLTVIFGMYGYDWPVDDKGSSTGTGKAVTDKAVTTTFLDSCSYAKCTVSPDAISAETTVKYTDNTGTNHAVWFEDQASSEKKKQYLKSRGISSFSYWAYSYF